MEKKLEEFQTIIMAQASEIADLKRCLQDLLASQPPLMSTESQKNPLDTQNKPRKNISESKNSCSSTLQHVTRHCELCEKPASLRCSKCQHVYYCDRDHQAKHWKSHKKLCDIISEDPMNTIAIEEINTYTDSDADTIQIVEKKKGQSLGLLLQFNETERVAYINDIVDNSITSFLVGDQITHINDARVTSIKKISAIVGSIETGKDIVFKVKRPKKQNQG